MSFLWLKFICPVIVLCIIWIWNKKRAEKGLSEENKEIIIPHYEFGVLDNETKEKISILPGIRSILENLELDGNMVKVYQVVIEENTVAAILFSWPSSLWRFRMDRGESEALGSYSHIHYVEVDEKYQKHGHLYRLMDMVISDTHRISSGITIDIEDPVLKSMFTRLFEFEDKGKYMILNYDNWS